MKRRRILFIHRNCPAHFAPIAACLANSPNWQVYFLSAVSSAETEGITHYKYQIEGSASIQTHFAARAFENGVWSSAGVYHALKEFGEKPDLIVSYSGFGSTLFASEIWPDVPIISYCCYFYRTRETALDFMPEWYGDEEDRLIAKARNAMTLLDLSDSTAGYSPTRFQKHSFPEQFQKMISVFHDGIDCQFWQARPGGIDDLLKIPLNNDARIITYVSRGFESIRGFHVLVRIMERMLDACKNLHFVIVGSEKCFYASDLKRTGGISFRDHCLSQVELDTSRIHFLGTIPPEDLVRVFSVSDLHIYLTAPYILSWSLLNAMACGCPVLASDTAPLHEVIKHNQNGFLHDFFDVEGLVDKALSVLAGLSETARIRRQARETIIDQFSTAKVLPQVEQFYREVLQ